MSLNLFAQWQNISKCATKNDVMNGADINEEEGLNLVANAASTPPPLPLPHQFRSFPHSEEALLWICSRKNDDEEGEDQSFDE